MLRVISSEYGGEMPAAGCIWLRGRAFLSRGEPSLEIEASPTQPEMRINIGKFARFPGGACVGCGRPIGVKWSVGGGV